MTTDFQPNTEAFESEFASTYSAFPSLLMNQRNRTIFRNTFGNTDTGRKLESFIMKNPSVTADTAAAAIVMGALDWESDLIDDWIRKDREGQEAAKYPWSPLWSGLKSTVRGGFILAEDLWNVNPLYLGARTLTNVGQGKGVIDSFDQSLATTGRTSISALRAGQGIDVGSGFIPSFEMSPQSPTFWEDVRSLVQSGQFEGSPQEQLIQAENAMRMQQMKANGINTFAITDRVWRSTHLHKTLADGTIVSTPLSPGSLAAIPFTTPGTRAFGVASGVFDLAARLLLEPLDVVADRTLQHLTKAKILLGDSVLWGKGQRGAIRNAFREWGIEVIDTPIIEVDPRSGARRVADDVLGRTSELVDTGAPEIQISLDVAQSATTDRVYGTRWNVDNPYARPWIEAGYTEEQFIELLNVKGGRNARVFATTEHELAHQNVQKKWFVVQTRDDGTKFIDWKTTTADAPEEVQAMSRQVVETDRVATELNEQYNEMSRLHREATEEADAWTLELDRPDISPQEAKEARAKVKEAKARAAQLEKDAKPVSKQTVEALDEWDKARGKLDDFIEYHATKTAMDNIVSGEWQAPKILKEAKRQRGIIQTWRPWVNPKTFTEWVHTKQGSRSMEAFARFDTIDEVLRWAPDLDPEVALRVADAPTPGEVTKIFGEAFYEMPEVRRPTVGVTRDALSRGLDAWEATDSFPGASIGTATSRLARRWGANAGHNILTRTNTKENLKVISEIGRTTGMDVETIDRIQRLAMEVHAKGNPLVGLRKVRDVLWDEILKRADEYQPGGLDAAQMKHIRNQWDLAEEQNHIYWTNRNTGRTRHFHYDGRKWQPINDGAGEAILESQFAATSIAMPNVRQLRRLTSNQRHLYEVARKAFPDELIKREKYLPLGLQSSAFMRGADWSFGIWRDMALFRMGWAMRILPEEHIRLGASGYSNLFNNPLEYIVFATQNQNLFLPGEVITLADIIAKNGLGTAVLRVGRGDDLHDAAHTSWVVVNRASNPDQFWAGKVRNVIHIVDDEVGRYVAEHGVEAAKIYFHSDEGKAIIRRIATDAAKDTGLDRIATPRILDNYLETIDLMVAEAAGGRGIYRALDELGVEHWYRTDGTQIRRASEFANKQELVAAIKAERPDLALSRATRPQLEALYNQHVIGVDLDALESQRIVAHVFDEGNTEIRSLLHTGTLDDIEISQNMSFDKVRELDARLRNAFETREVDPGDWINMPAGELIRDAEKGLYDKGMDAFFNAFNAVPSHMLNRSPHFSQAFGRQVALHHAFSNPEVRQGIEAWLDSQPALARQMFEAGQRKLMKEYQWVEWPSPTVVEDLTPSPAFLDEIADGIDPNNPPFRYMRIVADKDQNTYITQAFADALSEAGVIRLHETYRRGWGTTTSKTGLADLQERFLFHGTSKYVDPWQQQDAFLQQEIRLTYQRLVNPADEPERLRLTAQLEDLQSQHTTLLELMANPDEAPPFAPFQSGGMAITANRAFEYTGGTGGWSPDLPANVDPEDVVMVFDRRTLPPDYDDWINRVGDIEQHVNLQKFGLDDVEGFDAAWNELGRNRFRDPLTESELAEVNDIFFDLVQEARQATEDVVPGRWDTMPTKNRAAVIPRLQTERTDRLTTRLKEIWGAEGGRNGLPYSPDSAKWEHALLKYMESGHLTEWNVPVQMSRLERIMADRGIILTEAQRLDMRRLYQFRSYRPWEILTTTQDIVPVAVIPAGAVDSLLKGELMVVNQHALGDLAVLADQMTVPATPRAITSQSYEFNDWNFGTFNNTSRQRRWKDLQDEALREQTGAYAWWDEAPPFEFDEPIRDYSGGKRQFDEWALEWDEESPLSWVFRYPDEPEGTATYNVYLWANSSESRTYYQTLIRSLEDQIDAGIAPTMTIGDLNEGLLGDWLEHFDWSHQSEAYYFELSPFEVITREPIKQWDMDYGRLVEDLVTIEDLEKIHDHLVKATTIMNDMQTEFLKHSPLVPDPGRVLTQPIAPLTGQSFTIGILNEVREGMENGFTYGAEIQSVFDQAVARLNEWRVLNGLDEMTYPTDAMSLDWVENLVGNMEAAASYRLNVDVNSVPREHRANVSDAMFGTESYRYDWMETGGPTLGRRSWDEGMPSKEVMSDVEYRLKSSKEAAIAETTDLFYDLAKKSNIADALRLVFPFGDAWYEVLSRWINIMDPLKKGSQPYRNVRRLMVGLAAGERNGFISTNEYGEEVFNWPGMGLLTPGLDGLPVGYDSQMPISSLMFIDPTARGISGPSMTPWMQSAASFAQPYLDELPFLRDIVNWGVYGGAEEYQPGKSTNLADLMTPYLPTWMRRLMAAALDDDHREVYGNTKMRLFEALLASGDPKYDPVTGGNEAMKRAWDEANSAGTWLAWVRILESWVSPGQPQYQPQIQRPVIEGNIDHNNPLWISIVRLGAEYRHARELWGQSEADLYMVERFGVNPIILQSLSDATVQRPATWEWANWIAQNEWALDVAPLSAGAFAPKGEERFSHREWTNQFTQPYMEDGPTIRERNNPTLIMERIERSVGYEMLRYQDKQYEQTLEAIRAEFGENYSSSLGYRQMKKELDATLMRNRANIMAQFPIVESEVSGKMIGERQSVTGAHLYLELKTIGDSSTTEGETFRQKMPEHFAVANKVAGWFRTLEEYSVASDWGNRSPAWWRRGETQEAQEIIEMLVRDMEKLVANTRDPDAKEYARWVANYIIDPITKDWEWMESEFAPQLESYPTVEMANG